MTENGLNRWIRKLDAFVVGGSFPVFALAVLFCWEIFLIGMLMIPSSSSALGTFADDFRVWCFGYDPATGRLDWAYVMAMVLPQLMIASCIMLFWWEPLRAVARRPRALFFHAGTAALLVVGSAASFAMSGSEPARGELPFPAEDLRTVYEAPALSLVNQAGEPVELASLRGKVVVLTSVYASCPHTCPVILQQAKASVAALEPAKLDDLRIIAVTMDPENDDQDVLAMLAENHGLDAPLFNLVTGPVPEVESTLDRMQITRVRDPETGVINHANLFLLIDRDGKLAFRLGLGERQQRWLTTALGILLDESGTAG
jgi:protein SCO1/2